MEKLSEEFWDKRYASGKIGWDLGAPSTPLKSYFDQLENKSLKILIPGAGNAYEAEYLDEIGYDNVYVVEIAKNALIAFQKRYPNFPTKNLIHVDFFELEESFDLIVEQTFFCALDPSLRQKYAEKMHALLKPGGKLVGLLFNTDFEDGPPYGGSIKEYEELFQPLYSKVKIEPCYNSIEPRQGTEVFISLEK